MGYRAAKKTAVKSTRNSPCHSLSGVNFGLDLPSINESGEYCV